MTTEVDSLKRAAEHGEEQQDAKKPKTENGLEALASASANTEDGTAENMNSMKRAPMSKARENRLEQNRKAARESRRRKKLMIEELQRSVIFFSKANGSLKMQNDELSRRLMEAQARVAAIEGSKDANQAEQPNNTVKVNEVSKQGDEQTPAPQFLNEQVQAQAVATQAMYESQGFPAGAARAAAQAMNASTPAPSTDATQTPASGLPPMQPGATMQAMAAFQQAAAAAMQAAMGMNPAAANNPQQAYADAMSAFAQQAGQAQFASQPQGMPQPFMAFPPTMAMQMAWQQTSSGVPPTKPATVESQQPPTQPQPQQVNAATVQLQEQTT